MRPLALLLLSRRIPPFRLRLSDLVTDLYLANSTECIPVFPHHAKESGLSVLHSGVNFGIRFFDGCHEVSVLSGLRHFRLLSLGQSLVVNKASCIREKMLKSLP